MNEFSAIRRRLMTAMGIALATGAPGCSPSTDPSDPDMIGAPDATPDAGPPLSDSDLIGALDATPDAGPLKCGNGSLAKQFIYDAEGVQTGMNRFVCHGSPKDPGCDGAFDAGSTDASGSPACTKTYQGPLPPLDCPTARFMVHTCQDIKKVELVGNKCVYSICEPCICGRPWIVAGVARRAQLIESNKTETSQVVWSDTLHHDLLAEAWRLDAQDEHASIASFSQFSLELLAFAAPMEFLHEAIRAAADEVHHAEACLDLAQQLDAREFRPGPLAADDVQPARTLAEAVALAVHGGCVGETLAAVVAATAGKHATEQAFAAVQQRIANDEMRHAELAWRFVRWAWDVGGDDVRDATALAFAQALATEPAPAARHTLLIGVPIEVQHRYGRLPSREFVDLARGVMRQVVAPCARDLMAGFVGTASCAPASC